MIEEQQDFNEAVDAVLNWLDRTGQREETLLIVTGDHETGYLWGPGSDPSWMPVQNAGFGNTPGVKCPGPGLPPHDLSPRSGPACGRIAS